MNIKDASFQCIICGSETAELPVQADFRGVTSDCKPWPRLGNLLVCTSCAHVQKPPCQQWLDDVSRIYEEYQIYQLSGGAEQLVFHGTKPRPRSVVLLEQALSQMSVDRRGRLLDIGCGNGSLLMAFGKMFPEWEMVGSDTNPRFRDDVMDIPGVVQFCSDGLARLPGRFQIATLIHVLEHVTHPEEFLRLINQKLVDGGLLLVQVPDLMQNPFDLLVRDHCSHFVPETLRALVERPETGEWTVEAIENHWIPKEISVILRREARCSRAHAQQIDSAALFHQVDDLLDWLAGLVAHARTLATTGTLGIFGTGIGATWLAGMLPDLVDFFVDEDPKRHGKVHMGKPVLAPAKVQKGTSVYLVFPRIAAEMLCQRLQRAFPGVSFVVPHKQMPTP